MTALAKRSLPTLVGQIRREHEAVETGVRATIEAAIRCGDLLAEAKHRVGHGGWYGWLAENFPSTPQTAAAYMRLAANREQIESAPSIRGALKEIAGPQRSAIPPQGTAGDDSQVEALAEDCERFAQEAEAHHAAWKRLQAETAKVAKPSLEHFLALEDLIDQSDEGFHRGQALQARLRRLQRTAAGDLEAALERRGL